jgi:crotonobetainyl-CoA:carnitine CoA-transferase CaiB-like acyl-CoA transferase
VTPLDGVRVLDLTRLLPGAYATLLLANLGAEIVKVEDPRGGDTMRTLHKGPSSYFEPLNRGKRSVTLNLRSPDAAAVLDALIARADVLVQSFRPSTARRLGVDAPTLRARHPKLICASISGFGQDGPYVEWAAHDINYQALAGLLRPPQLPGPLVGDVGSAQQAACAIVAALFERTRTGSGSTIDISIHEAALEWSIFPTTGDLAQACYNVYETADGEWLALGALEEKFWTTFCERVGLPVTATVDEVRAKMRERTREEWLAQCAGADVCLTTVYERDEVANDPHVIARGVASQRERHAPKNMDSDRRSAPALGADTDALLDAAGIDRDARERLRAAGTI